MKLWHGILIGVLFGLLAGAMIWIILAPPRGKPVTLLPAPTAEPLRIHLSGEVQSPGLYALPEGSRVDDAIRAAGGLTAQANAESVNLAAQISDGQRIHVPPVGQSSPAATKLDTISSGAQSGDKINLNTAEINDLVNLPGIGEGKAQEIIAYRQKSGGFSSIEEIMEVPGIGEGIFEQIKDLIEVQ